MSDPTSTPRRRIITQDDVARHAGVTRSIVSYVINNGPRNVAPDTRERVLTAIKELGYRPNKHAQNLSSADFTEAEKCIGIILAGDYMFKRPYYGTILASIHEHAHKVGWHIRFIRVFEDFCNPALFDELIHPNEIRGMILFGLDHILRETSEHGRLVEEIVRRVERVVCIESVWPGLPCIQFDLPTAAFQATEHLLTHGRRRIAYIGPTDKRIDGYQQALRNSDIGVADQITFRAADPQEGYDSCEHLISSGWAFDAICAGTDEAAYGIMNCLYRHGMSVPDSVAVASIDNIYISSYTVPPLTTVDLPKHEMGHRAVDLLISDETWKSPESFSVVFPSQLIVRETSISQAISPTPR